MSVYALISSILSYVFTTIIYLFIFSIIVLIYKDIKRSGKEDIEYDEETNEEYEEEEDVENTAILITVKTSKTKEFNLKSKYRIGEGPIIIGRSPECDIIIPDMYLSQEHFKIWFDKDTWYIGDLKSKNGTFLNNAKIKRKAILEDDDVISFGGINFVFQSE